MKKCVLSLVVLGSWFSSTDCMMVPVPQGGVSFGQSSMAFDLNSLNCVSKAADVYGTESWSRVNNSVNFWTEEDDSESAEDNSKDFSDIGVNPYLGKWIASEQRSLDIGSWNVSNNSNLWVGRSNEPTTSEVAWSFSLPKSLSYLGNTELPGERNQKFIFDENRALLSIPRVDSLVSSFSRNNFGPDVIVQNAENGSANALIHGSDSTEISLNENQTVTDLICKSKPEEKSVWKLETTSQNLSQRGGSLLKQDGSQKVDSRMASVALATAASAWGGIPFAGKSLKRIASRALARGASLISLGSKIVFSAVSAPVVFAGLRILGVGPVKSFTTAGAFAISPFVVSPSRMLGKSIGFASRGGRLVYRGTRSLMSSARKV